MAWLKFVRDINWPPGKSWHVAYKAGMRCNVPSAYRKDLLASGAAKAMTTPQRAAAEQLKADPYWQAPAASGSGAPGAPAERPEK